MQPHDPDGTIRAIPPIAPDPEMERFLDSLTRDPANLMPWIRAIYPTLWREYLAYMDAAPGEGTERGAFAFDLLQPLHQ